MIDLTTETPITLREARNHRLLARVGPGGKPLSVTTIERWTTRGVDGVKLDFARVGRTVTTTEAAIVRFIEQLTHPHLKDGEKTPAASKKSHESAARALDQMGI